MSALKSPAVTETVCSHCLTVNRLPTKRLREPSNCGRCAQLLFGGDPIHLNDETFDRLVLREELPVVVDFWAEWCGPCHAMAPAFAAAARELAHSHRFVKVDVDKAIATARRFGILSIPTLALMQQGREVARSAGVMRAPQLVSWIMDSTQPAQT